MMMDNSSTSGATPPRVAMIMDMETGEKEWVPEGHDLRSNMQAEATLTEAHFEAIEVLSNEIQELIEDYEHDPEYPIILSNIGVTINAGKLKLALEAYKARTNLLRDQIHETNKVGQQLAEVAGRIGAVEAFARNINEQLRHLPASVDHTITLYQRIMAEQAMDRARQESRIAELRMLAAEAADTPAHRSEMKLAKEKIRLLQETIRTSNDASRAAYVSQLEVAHKELSEEVGELRQQLDEAKAAQQGSYTGLVDELRRERDEAKGEADRLAREVNELAKANAENISLHSAASIVGQLSAFIDGLAHSLTATQNALNAGRFESDVIPALGGETASGEAEKAAQEALERKFGQGPTPEDPHAPIGHAYRTGEPLNPDMFPGSDYPANLPSPVTPDLFPGMTPGADQ